MKNTSTIGMSFLEKLIAVLLPVVLGAIGWILPKLLGFVTKIPVLSDLMIVQLLDSFNAFWVSVILLVIGAVIGILFALTIYSEALKMSIKEQEIQIDQYDKKSIIKRPEAKDIFMENHTVVIIGNKGQELLREKTDIQRNKIRDIFLNHEYSWREKDPYENDFIRWTLDDTTLEKKVNEILYERRNAIREGDKKKVKHLKRDLNELGIIVKDRNEDQYVRKVQE